ncbi:MAG TPA: hypothetical protein VE869_11475 [Gemmatimonas sp.]|nr:hypothetical protein [Gemmatimonas sp.]
MRVTDAAGERSDDDAKVLLEGDGLVLRGPARVSVPRSSITGMTVHDGVLHVDHAGGTVALTLGDAADKWMAKIAEGPRSRVTKLGVKPGMRVLLIAVNDPTVGRECADAGAVVLDEHGPADGAPPDLILMEIGTANDLAGVAVVAGRITAGVLWIVHPNGVPEVSDTAIFPIAERAGMVVTKTMSFSAGMSADRLSRRKSPGRV